MSYEALAYFKMLYFNILTFLILKVLFFEYIVAFPNENKVQGLNPFQRRYVISDTDANEKFDLVKLLKNHSKNENEHESESVKNGSLVRWKWMEGKWTPIQPGEYTPPPKVYHKEEHADNGNVEMGVKRVKCDDGKTNLTVDWDHSPTSYTCLGSRIVPDLSLAPEYYNDTIPKYYIASHRCMHRNIDYSEDFPTFGTHRPIWPVYGEYKYLPTQRWLHSLEHGAVVMLYHPCANILEIQKLKKTVRGCLRRHIISRNNRLNEKRPFALLTWGHKLIMSHVDENLVKQFIRDTGLRGPEDISDDGDFDDQLIRKADYGSDGSDESDESEEAVSTLCSKLK